MKSLLFTFFLITSIIGYSQVYQNNTLYGQQQQRIVVTTDIGFPKDTFQVPNIVLPNGHNVREYVHVAFIGDDMYIWSPDQLKWVIFASGGSGGSNFYTQDGQIDDAARNVYVQNSRVKFRDSASSYVDFNFINSDNATFDSYMQTLAGDHYSEIYQQKDGVFFYQDNMSLNFTNKNLAISVDSSFIFSSSDTLYKFLNLNSSSSYKPLMIINDKLAVLDTIPLTNTDRWLWWGEQYGQQYGSVDIHYSGGVAFDVVSQNPYTANHNEVSFSAFGSILRNTYGTNEALISAQADSAFSQIRLKAAYIDFEGLATDNTATQLLGKDANGHSVWVDVSGLGGGGGSLPSLSQYHFYVGDGSSAPVDAGSSLTLNGSNFKLSVGSAAFILNTPDASTDAKLSFTRNGTEYGTITGGAFNNRMYITTSSDMIINNVGGLNILAMSAGGVAVGGTPTSAYKLEVFGTALINNNLTLSKYVSGTIPTGTAAYNLAVTSTGDVIGTPVVSASTPGIDDVLAVGQTLSATRLIDAGSNQLQVTSNISSPNFVMPVSNTGTGHGISISTNSGNGIQVVTGTGLPAFIQGNATSTNTVAAVADFVRQSTGTAASGIAGSLEFFTKTSSGGAEWTNALVWKLTDITSTSKTSQWEFQSSFNGSAPQTRFTIAGEGWTKLEGISATQASAITASDGMMVYVTSTNGTFTSIGFWGRENGAWVKL